MLRLFDTGKDCLSHSSLHFIFNYSRNVTTAGTMQQQERQQQQGLQQQEGRRQQQGIQQPQNANITRILHQHQGCQQQQKANNSRDSNNRRDADNRRDSNSRRTPTKPGNSINIKDASNSRRQTTAVTSESKRPIPNKIKRNF
jgi:hypothetical protein